MRARHIYLAMLLAGCAAAIGLAPETANADSWRSRCGTPSRPYYHPGQSYGYGAYGNGYSYRPGGYGYSNNGGYRTEHILRKGINNGQLSWREVRDIRRDEQDLRRKESAYLADGWLSRGERRSLKDERKELYQGIRHNLRDGERRW